MASTDARPIPKKNAAYRVTFPIFDADGDLVTGAGALDSEYSGDAGAFGDCANEAIEIAAASGIYYLDLIDSEMNFDTVAIIVKTDTSGAKTTPIVVYPVAGGIKEIYSDTTIVASDVIVVDAALSTIHSETTVIQVDADNAYSDTTVIEAWGLGSVASDAAAVESELILVHSETTIVASDVIVVDAALSTIHSETTVIQTDANNIYSDTTIIASDVVLVYSDTTVIEAAGGGLTAGQASDLVAIESELILVHSETTVVQSDVVVLDAAVSDVESSLVVVKSDLVVLDNAVSDVESSLVIVRSDLVVVESDATAIESELILVHSETTVVQSDVAAIEADTGTDGVVISATTANALADALLKRDWTAVAGEAARSVLNALRLLRNKASIAGGTLTVTEEDDVTAAWTATVTTDAAADPVTAVDPA